MMAVALGKGAVSPPPRHGPSLSPLRELRWRVRRHGWRGPGRLHAVPGRVRVARRRPGGEEAGRPGGGRGTGPGPGLGPALTAPPALAAEPLAEHRALHRVAAAGGRAGRRDLPNLRRGDLAGEHRGGPLGPTGAGPSVTLPPPPQVTLVGIVRHAEKAPTNILYKVDDMTAAPMDVRQWVDTDVSTGFAMSGLL